jgi:hypothetical protein
MALIYKYLNWGSFMPIYSNQCLFYITLNLLKKDRENGYKNTDDSI